jgi:hypothetical protein
VKRASKPIDEKRKTIGHLESLRDHNRLAIHVCEVPDRYAFPTRTCDLLSEVHAGDIGKHMANDTANFLSVSLLPNAKLKKSVRPWGTGSGSLPYSYLIDLDQDKEHPARVIYANPQGLLSGINPHAKVYWDKSVLSNLMPLYEKYGTPHNWEQAIAADPELAKSVAAQQLDALADYYTRNAEEHDFAQTGVMEFNEVIAAVSRQHVAAIAVPYGRPNSQDNECYQALVRLTGALCGLQHLNMQGNGKPMTEDPEGLPVVAYQVVDGKNARRNNFVYIGKGYAELTDVALKAVAELQTCDRTELLDVFDSVSNFILMTKALRDTLGIEFKTPLAEQVPQVQKLRRAIHESVKAASNGASADIW